MTDPNTPHPATPAPGSTPAPPAALPAVPPAPRAARVSRLGRTATILGVLGLLTFWLGVGFALGLVALICGLVARIRINRRPRELAGLGFAKAGIITGLCTLVLIPFVWAAWLPVRSTRVLSDRTHCSATIAVILRACAIYAADNDNEYPTAGNYTGPGYTLNWGAGGPVARDRTQALNLIQSDPRYVGNPASCLWILILQDAVPARTLICRGDTQSSPSPLCDSAGNYYLAPANQHQLSYSIATPWFTAPDDTTIPTGYWHNHDSDIIVVADMTPMRGTGDPKRDFRSANIANYNTGNHGGQGQNLGWDDGHVDWRSNGNCGQSGDIVYLAGLDAAARGAQPTAGQSIALYDVAVMVDVYMIPVRNLDDHTLH